MNHTRRDGHLVVGGLILVALRSQAEIIHQLGNLMSFQWKDPRLLMLWNQNFLLCVTFPMMIHMISCQVHTRSIHMLRQWRLQLILLRLPRVLIHHHEGLRIDKNPCILFGYTQHATETASELSTHRWGKLRYCFDSKRGKESTEIGKMHCHKHSVLHLQQRSVRFAEHVLHHQTLRSSRESKNKGPLISKGIWWNIPDKHSTVFVNGDQQVGEGGRNG